MDSVNQEQDSLVQIISPINRLGAIKALWVAAGITIFLVLGIFMLLILDKYGPGILGMKPLAHTNDWFSALLVTVTCGFLVINTVRYQGDVGDILQKGTFSNEKSVKPKRKKIVIGLVITNLMATVLAIAYIYTTVVGRAASLFLIDVLFAAVIFFIFMLVDKELFHIASAHDIEKNQGINSWFEVAINYVRWQLIYVDLPGFIGFTVILVLSLVLRIFLKDVPIHYVQGFTIGATGLHMLLTQVVFTLLRAQIPEEK